MIKSEGLWQSITIEGDKPEILSELASIITTLRARYPRAHIDIAVKAGYAAYDLECLTEEEQEESDD